MSYRKGTILSRTLPLFCFGLPLFAAVRGLFLKEDHSFFVDAFPPPSFFGSIEEIRGVEDTFLPSH